jgi:transcriptional regulator with XRE-family HTH domain
MRRPVKNLCGPAVKKARFLLELSQEQLAAKGQRMGWDVSRDVLAKIEGQSRWVSDIELVLLAELLEIDAKELLYPARKALRLINL